MLCGAGLAALAGVTAVLALAAGADQASAQMLPSYWEKTISVTGVATMPAEPDLLVIRFGVEIQDDTAIGALESNSQAMNGVIDSVKSLGVTEDEISTTGFSIRPVHGRYDEQTGQSPMIGYRVTNTVMVKTCTAHSAADIIDRGVAAGANRVDDVSFALSAEKRQVISDRLVAGAILDAQTKAQNALSPLGYEITGVKAVSISEHGVQPAPYSHERAFALSAATPIFDSDQDVTAAVNIVFIIDAAG